jgi:hypothetical protein
MNFFEQLKAVSKLNGQFTEGVLVRKGISKSAVARAVNFGLLKSDHTGMLSTIQAGYRTGRLVEALAADLRPGSQIGVLNGDTRQVMQRQVVRVDGNEVYVIDPSNPQQVPEKVPFESVSIGDEKGEDNKPIDPERQKLQQQEPKPEGMIDNPTPTI